MTTETSTTGADLTDYVRIIRRHWLLIVAATAIGVALAVLYTRLQTPGYDSKASVQIQDPKGQVGRDQSISDVQTEAQVMKSEGVAKLAAASVRGGHSAQDLLDHVTVKAPTEARVLVVSFNAKSPREAKAGAQAMADAYIAHKTDQAQRAIKAQVQSYQPSITLLSAQFNNTQTALSKVPADSAEGRNLNQQLTRLTAQLAQDQASQATAAGQPIDGGRVLSPATLPRSKAGTGLVTNIGIGALTGLILGIILTFTRDRFDEQVYGVADIEHVTGVPTLGTIPVFPRRHRSRRSALVMLHAPDRAHADAFRRLRSSLLLALRASDAQVLACTSAGANEGKSTVSANLAVSLSQAGYRACLVSADVRRPTLNEFFEIEDGPGLMEVLEGTSDLEQALTRMGALNVIRSGHAKANPTDLLQSAVMEKVLVSLRQQFDYIVLDTSPVLAVADVLALVPVVDAVILVVSASATTEDDLATAQAQLHQAGAKIVGAVVNRSVASTHRYDAYVRTAT